MSELLYLAAWWITSGNVLSLAMLVLLVAAAIVSWRAVRDARDDVAYVAARFPHRRDTEAAHHSHRRREDGATLLLARARARSEKTRFLALVLIAGLEALTLVLPAVGTEMPDTVVLVLALRKVGRLGIAVLLIWWLIADHLDRRRVLAHVRAYGRAP